MTAAVSAFLSPLPAQDTPAPGEDLGASWDKWPESNPTRRGESWCVVEPEKRSEGGGLSWAEDGASLTASAPRTPSVGSNDDEKGLLKLPGRAVQDGDPSLVRALCSLKRSQFLPLPLAGMGLRESPYSNRLLGAMNAVVQNILFPSYWLLNQLLALQRTTAEKQAQKHKRCPPYPLMALAKGMLLLPALLLITPVSLLAFLAWLPLQAARRPFAYQHTPGQASPEECPLAKGQGQTFGFISGNVCLLPEGLAKFSNLAQTQWRAEHVGRILSQAAGHSSISHAPSYGNGTPNGHTYGAMGSSPPRAYHSLPTSDTASVAIEIPLETEEAKAGPLGEITPCFPPKADFVCLQEVFDLRATTRLCQALGRCYEYILYDVGVYGLVGCSKLKLFNSGLFLASRHPILAAQYHCYPNSIGEDALASKGLLCVKVQLGSSSPGQRIVGYLNCTHMHAPEADAQVRYDQLTLSLLWAQLFQDANTQPGDVVAFDIYCGDLNFDNCSSGDELEQGHEIFKVYTDPCRIGPRKDKPWVIGTLLDYLEIYNEAVSTPERLKRTLEQPEGRKKFIAGPVLADGHPDPSATESEGRRLDYILYREHPGPLALRTNVEKVSFVTQLATCSDHLPLGVRLHVTPTAKPEA